MTGFTWQIFKATCCAEIREFPECRSWLLPQSNTNKRHDGQLRVVPTDCETPITSPSGAKYILLMKNSYSSALQVYGMLPGYTTCGNLVRGDILPRRTPGAPNSPLAQGRRTNCHGWARRPREMALESRSEAQSLREAMTSAALFAISTSWRSGLNRWPKRSGCCFAMFRTNCASPLTRLGVALGLARAEAPGEMCEHLNRIDTEAARPELFDWQILSLSQMDALHNTNQIARLLAERTCGGLVAGCAVRSGCRANARSSTRVI